MSIVFALAALFALTAAMVFYGDIFVPALLLMLGVPLTFFGAMGMLDGEPSLIVALLAGVTMLAAVRFVLRGTRSIAEPQRVPVEHAVASRRES